ncbi:hypothetical protein TSUD_45370 [Trifolium subterraneum]|nr:hypothetical protein TSUD_45370 [Trifolium subterraneum]
MIALKCTDGSPDKRPSMEEVVEWLRDGGSKRKKDVSNLSNNKGDDEGNDENYEEFVTMQTNHLKIISDNDRRKMR